MPPPDLPFRNVSWKVLTRCNYRCSYCLQPSFDTGWPKDIEATAAVVSAALGERYEIKLAGGELTSVPVKAVRLVRALARDGHWISVGTNLSASDQDLEAIIAACEERFYHLQASLHLEYDDPEAFLIKCKRIRAILPGHAKLTVANVIPRDLAGIRRLGSVKTLFEQTGITFYTDLEVDQVGRYLSYTSQQLDAIDNYLGAETRLFLSRNAHCRAGDSYFVLLPDLDAWSCWDAFYHDRRDMYYGNLAKGSFCLPRKTTICPFATCSCPTPMIKHTFKLSLAKAGMTGDGGLRPR
jgi:hypothetical protein